MLPLRAAVLLGRPVQLRPIYFRLYHYPCSISCNLEYTITVLDLSVTG